MIISKVSLIGMFVYRLFMSNEAIFVSSVIFISFSLLASRWEDNIRMDLEEIGINAGNWVDSAQDRDYWRALVNAALNLQIP